MSTAGIWGWDWNPWVVASCAAMLAGYAVAVRFRFTARAASWGAGVLLILLALVSPLNGLAGHYLFSAHMAQHVLFILVVPPLLLLGMPPQPVARRMRRRRTAFAAGVLGRPAVAWTAGIGAMAFWHIPVIFNTAASHAALHAVEHASLLLCGTAYWWPILSPLENSRMSAVPHAAAYLFTSCLACTSMGILITFAPRLLYPGYAHPAGFDAMLPLIREQWGISPALDQQVGGLIMWVPGCLVYLTAIMGMFARWYREGEQVAVEV